MMDRVIQKAHAKINLFLNILNKRNDGYHSLQMIMAPLHLHDTVVVSKSQHERCRSNNPALPTDRHNLCVQALHLMRQSYPVIENVDIYIHKIIPICAGLGSGSTNAAAVIQALIQLYQLNVSSEQQSMIASQIGMDVPFFLYKEPMIAYELGNQLKTCVVRSYQVVLVKPKTNISTQAAYALFDSSERQSTQLDYPDFRCQDEKKLSSMLLNVFEPIIFKHYAEVEQVKQDLLSAGAPCACLTGSGSAVFALFIDKHRARKVYDAMRWKYDEVFLTVILGNDSFQQIK